MKKSQKYRILILCLLIQCFLLFSSNKHFKTDETTVIPNTGQFVDGQINDELGDTMIYDLYVTKTSKLILTIKAYGNIEASLCNYSFSNLRLTYASQLLKGNSSKPEKKAIELYVMPGKYTVILKNKSPGKNVSFKIKSALESIGSNEREPNDFDNAMQIKLGTTIRGGLNVQDSEDWYKITLPSKYARLNVKANCPTKVRIYNEDLSQTLINKSLNGNEVFFQQETWEFSVPATYYVCVAKEKLNSEGKYTLKWTTLEAPKNIKVKPNTLTSLKISWDLTGGGTNYQVYRSTSKNGKYTLLGIYDEKTTSSISKTLTIQKTYYYKVRAYRWVDGERVFSPFSEVVKGKTALKKPSKVSAKAQTSTSAKISWNKIEGATHYQVYRGSSAYGKYTLLGTYDNKATSSISRSLKKGNIYYYKVRAYKWVNGKRIFSPFSIPVNVKI